uniref:Putative secreted protein n=1 Tax=Anopheles marajoara TaxID=58244 RepID=A0A2M4C767_9DIPT
MNRSACLGAAAGCMVGAFLHRAVGCKYREMSTVFNRPPLNTIESFFSATVASVLWRSNLKSFRFGLAVSSVTDLADAVIELFVPLVFRCLLPLIILATSWRSSPKLVLVQRGSACWMRRKRPD